MQRLYKFFFLLFLVLFAISFLYGTLASWGFFKLLQVAIRAGSVVNSFSFSAYAETGLIQAVIYSLAQFASLIFLLRLSVQQQKKFTLKDIIHYQLCFLALTSVVFIIYVLWFSISNDMSVFLLLGGPNFSLPIALWLPFLIAWLVLYIFLAQKIKRQAAYGRKD